MRGIGSTMPARATGPAIKILQGWADKAQAKMEGRVPRMSHQQLADRIGYDQGTVSRALRDLRGGMDLFAAMAKALDLPEPWILVTEQEDAKWYEMGKTIRELAPEEYAKLLPRVQQIFDSVKKIRESLEGLGVAPDTGGSEGPAKTPEHESSPRPGSPPVVGTRRPPSKDQT
jgi:transcriptional regulator with XRE-family HTH domain